MADDPRNDSTEDPDSHVPEPLEAGLAAGFGPAGRMDEPDPSVLELIASTSGVRPRVSLRDEPSEAPSRLLKPLGPHVAGWPTLQGKYQVQGEIARGGVGVVLKGHDIDLGRDVAVKVLHEKYLGNPDLMQRFVEEAQIGGQLQHPGIVPVYDLGLSDDRPYFTMKLIKGRTLAALFEEQSNSGSGRRQLLGVFEQVCQTMAYAHARGVIHRDLKPANVMVGAFGEVQIVDWGMGKVLSSGGTADEERSQKSVQSVIETVRSQPGSGSTHSIVGSVMGTPAYMPPEQANGDVEHMDERSDVFALGAILCEILTGAPPYVGESDERIIMAAKAELGPCRARLEACDADDELRELCSDCLMPAPATRPRHAGKVAERIATYRASVEKRAREAQVEAAEERVRSGAARRSLRLTLALAASVLATLIVAGAGAWWMESEALARRATAAELVTRSLEEVGALLAEARAGGGADLVPWDRVAAAATSMLELAALDDVSAERLEAARAMHARATAERAQAVREADELSRGARLLERLGRVRVPPDEGVRGDDWPRSDAERQDGEYGAAFSEYFDGRPIEGLSADEAVSSLSRRELHTSVAAALDHWALLRDTLNAWDEPQGKRGTRHLWQIAEQVDGEDPWRSGLRALLPEVREQRAGLEQFARQADLASLSAESVALLGEALSAAGSLEQALEVLRRGRQLHPSDFGICMRLAIHLWRLDDQPLAEIVDVLRVAHALRPEMEEVQHLRGMGLHDLGRFQEERRLWEDLVDEDPGSVHWLLHLGFALGELGDLEGRVDVERRRFQLSGPEAQELNINHAASASAKMGVSLEGLGRYEEALQAFRTGLELIEPQRRELERNGHQNTLDWGRRCTSGARRVEALLAELPLLEEVLRGDRAPTSTEEGLRAAGVALDRQHYELAARTYGEVFFDAPFLEIAYDERYDAICAAALCGTGRGLNAESLDAIQRSDWRRLAAAGLRDELAAQLERSDADTLAVAERLQSWQRDPDLTGLREEAGLTELPLAERSEWRQFWAEVNVSEEILRDEASGD